MPALEPWSVLADVAGHLHVSEDTVLRWIAQRKLPAHRVGRVCDMNSLQTARRRRARQRARGTFNQVTT